jgi:hypothetical protein
MDNLFEQMWQKSSLHMSLGNGENHDERVNIRNKVSTWDFKRDV